MINRNLILPDLSDDATRNAVERNRSGKSSAELAITWRAADAFLFYTTYISVVSVLSNYIYIAGDSVRYRR